MGLLAVSITVEKVLTLGSKAVLSFANAHIAALFHQHKILVKLVSEQVDLLLGLLGFIGIFLKLLLCLDGLCHRN